MSRGSFGSIVRAVTAVGALALASGCFVYAETPVERRPLTQAEMAVRVLPDSMNLGGLLQKSCRPIRGVVTVTSEYDMRVAAVAAGANTAEVLSADDHRRPVGTAGDYTVYEKWKTFDVRLWDCAR
jgi:hypothetical protein